MYSENSNILDERRPIMDTKKIGAFIAMNRKKKGYTQEQLADHFAMGKWSLYARLIFT